MVCYNDISALKTCFPSIEPFIDGCILVDGAWKEYPTDKPHSTDGSPEYIKEQMKDKYFKLIRPKERLTCVDSMNMYMKAMDDEFDNNTWALGWDTDWELLPVYSHERWDIVNEFNEVREKYECKILYMKLRGWRPDVMEAMPEGMLGHRDIKGARYMLNHWTVFHNGVSVRAFPNNYPIYSMKTCMVNHRFFDRPRERLIEQNEYYKARKEWTTISSQLKSNYPLIVDRASNVGYDMEKLFRNKELMLMIDDYGKCKYCNIWKFTVPGKDPLSSWIYHYQRDHPDEYVGGVEDTLRRDGFIEVLKLEDITIIHSDGSIKCKFCDVWNYRYVKKSLLDGWLIHYRENHSKKE